MAEYAALTETTFYILLSLWNTQHGYGIMQSVESMSGGRVRLAAGTLYGALTAMCEKGWIVRLEEDADSRRKDYALTETGRGILMKETDRLRELLRNAEAVTGGENHV